MQTAVFRTIIREGQEAESRLAELSLTSEGLRRAVLAGEYARAEATPYDPLTAEGTDAYRYRIRTIREVLCPLGWTLARDRGLEVTVSPSGRHRIITRAGDGGVGRRDGHPMPKNPIGDTTDKVLAVNTALYLDPDWMNVPPANESHSDAPIQTWMLLVAREYDIACSELSLPTRNAENGTPLGWIERILLPMVDLSEPAAAGEDQGGPAIDVPVTRKA